MKKIMSWGLAATFICGFTMGVTSCDDKSDNPVPAKKRYRLVQHKQVFNDNQYAIADYSYDSQGRLKHYNRVIYYVDRNDSLWDADYTYTYGDHYILEKHHEKYYDYYTLNDDGLIITEETRTSPDEPATPAYYFQYVDGKISGYREREVPSVMTFNWEGDDLMTYGWYDVDGLVDNTEFTRSSLTVDHGYMAAPMVMMSDALYMMGYYGKPSKHLESHCYKVKNQGANVFVSYDHEYTYTIADGHIVEMVDNSSMVLHHPILDRTTNSTTISTFTYEEY